MAEDAAQGGGGTPPYLMRWCRSYTDIEGFVDVLAAGEPLTPAEYKRLGVALAEWKQLVAAQSEDEQAATLELWAAGGEAMSHPLSVYACQTRDVLDEGHALGVVAVTLGYLAQARDARKAAKSRKGATLLLHTAMLLKAGIDVPCTPGACDTLCVAAPRHHDITLTSTTHLAFLNVCHQVLGDPSNVHKIGPKEGEQPFHQQVCIVLRCCRDGVWALREGGAHRADAWASAGTRSVEEQVTALLKLAAAVEFDWAS
jgi:hypothetical protein